MGGENVKNASHISTIKIVISPRSYARLCKLQTILHYDHITIIDAALGLLDVAYTDPIARKLLSTGSKRRTASQPTPVKQILANMKKGNASDEHSIPKL